jgi:3-deoxy-7-phosphoheptulonate synthase
MSTPWTPAIWRTLPTRHVPTDYPDPAELAHAESELASRPGLVKPAEVRRLHELLAIAADGRAMLLQGGDCAESFRDYRPDHLRDYFRLLLQMAVVLTFAGGKPVVKLGRIAGQFAKPRSDTSEIRDGTSLPLYRGDIINGAEYTPASRTPDPMRMLQAYDQSASTLGLLRPLAAGGFANLHNVRQWTLDFIADHPLGERYRALSEGLVAALNFLDSIWLDQATRDEISRVEFFSSHEGLLLPYEEALTRRDPEDGRYYALSAHSLWIGERTRQLDGGHVAFAAGIANPIGVKVGPTMEPDELLFLIDALDPHNAPGRLTLIGRFGADKIGARLPALLAATRKAGRTALWASDPMHGNTIKAENGYKTRPFDRILSEVRDFVDICAAQGVHAGGVHLELTGQNVTECLGGAHDVAVADLSNRYHTHCDPRLNAHQALELAFLIAERIAQVRKLAA